VGANCLRSSPFSTVQIVQAAGLASRCVEETADGIRFLGNIATPAGVHTITVEQDTHAVWIASARETESFVCKLNVPRWQDTNGSHTQSKHGELDLFPDHGGCSARRLKMIRIGGIDHSVCFSCR
jgi:hypothetical protein